MGADRVGTPTAQVALSTASVYPRGVAAAFELAGRLGYDAVEVMVWTEPASQEAGALLRLAELHQVRICSIHAPTLLLTQRVWGTDPWAKVDNSIALAEEVGADTVVLHPPFRWQREYAADFIAGIAGRQAATHVKLAVENMFPWRAGAREIQAYLPDWDPVDVDYRHVTLDLSHTATAGSDAMAMVTGLGDRLAHLHLADGTGSYRDEHLVPGRGDQPCAQVLQALAVQDFRGAIVVEVGTRRQDEDTRDLDLAEALAFARLHFAAPPTTAASDVPPVTDRGSNHSHDPRSR
ncbi:sugar phosphate isomerase/epimerase family protein [Dermacoccaceae bacterium W4C1]